jgi:hypothetical protein
VEKIKNNYFSIYHMEKLEDNDDEIENIRVEENEDNIIKNVLNKLNTNEPNNLLINELSECYKSKKKLEHIEDKLIKKIYEKFSIKELIDIKEPIDFVFTYEESLNNNNSAFFLNLEIIRHNLPFLRNIIIITPTPNHIHEIYANDNQIYILNVENIEKYKKSTTLFKPNYLIYFLKDLNYLSNVFFYAESNCIISQPMKKEDFFKNNIPVINMTRKTLYEDRNPEEYYANREFEKKFGVFNHLIGINQVNIIRKDVLIMMYRLYGIVENIVDYLTLQYIIGYYFKIYDLELKNHNASGFYQYTIQIPYERFNTQSKYFCFQFVNQKIIPYYVKCGLIHLGIMRNNPISTIYVVGQNMKYCMSQLERLIGGIVKLVFIENGNKQMGKMGENIFIIDKDEKIDVDTIVIKINGEYLDKIIPDILYFGNIYIPHKKEYEHIAKYKEKNNMIQIIYPRIVIKNRLFLIKLLGYGDTNNEIFGEVKQGYIQFINKIKK